MIILTEIFLLILAYLLGYIPTALIISKVFFNIDIRNYGSHNMGSTNVFRVLGFKYGIATFILDALKAGLIVFLFRINLISPDVYHHINPLFYGFAAVIGHIFPVFAKFKGGKGIACGSGIILAYAPLHFSIAFLVFILVLLIFKYVSLSSILASFSLLFTSFFIPVFGKKDLYFMIFSLIIFVTVLITHRKNIIKLFNRTESKITKQENEKHKIIKKTNLTEFTENKKNKVIIKCHKNSKFTKRYFPIK